ncbi:MAG: ABC transporter transmembrane domain-containing protein [Sphingomonadales bacterium]
MRELYSLAPFFWKYRLRLAAGFGFVLLSNYFNVLSPQVTGFIIDHVQRALTLEGYQSPVAYASYDRLVKLFIHWIQQWGTDVSTVVALCGAVILLLALLRGVFLFMMRQTLIVMSRYIEYEQKNQIFSHYQSLDAAFFREQRTGDLMNRITEDVSRVRMFTGPAIMYMANLVSVISLSLYFMFRRNVELTIYVLLPLPALAVAIYYINNLIHRRSERIQETLSDLTTHAQETYSGIRVVKAFAQEQALSGFFRQIAGRYKKEVLGLVKVESLYFPSISLLIGLSTLLTIMIGGLYYIAGSHSIGLSTIVEFVMYINMLTFPVSAIGLTASMVQRAAASQQRINEF